MLLYIVYFYMHIYIYKDTHILYVCIPRSVAAKVGQGGRLCHDKVHNEAPPLERSGQFSRCDIRGASGEGYLCIRCSSFARWGNSWLIKANLEATWVFPPLSTGWTHTLHQSMYQQVCRKFQAPLLIMLLVMRSRLASSGPQVSMFCKPGFLLQPPCKLSVQQRVAG